MPIFEYRCRDCGAKFEKILSSAARAVTCKNCGSPHLEKLLSVFSVPGVSLKTAARESGPCGACGAPRRGMCED